MLQSFAVEWLIFEFRVPCEQFAGHIILHDGAARALYIQYKVQHIEFFHTDHFEDNYYRTPPPAALSAFIDFFWETKFDKLWKQYPSGFSDTLFPNIGYTYLFNLGSPFKMQVHDKKIDMRSDGFLPRHKVIQCFHQPGNHLFGIKFRVSPVVFTKRINFSEYWGYVYPLSYLLDPLIIRKVKQVASFESRRNILSNYFLSVLKEHDGSLKYVSIVLEILEDCYQQNDFTSSVESLADKYAISTRTLQRYFESTTGFSSKKALQIMRIRKAAAHLANSPEDFHLSLYGYYDKSHFYKHLRQFLHKKTFRHMELHLKLANGVDLL